MMTFRLPDFGWFRAPSAPAPAVFSGIAQVRAYWEGLRIGGAIPGRAQLDPRGLGGVLDRVFLAEGVGRGVAQIRIAGSALADFAGLDPRGLPLSCLFAAESRALATEVLAAVLAGDTLAELDLGADRGRAGRPVARLLLLPLQDGDRRLVLGAAGLATDAQGGGCKWQVLARREERLPQIPAGQPGLLPDLPPAPIRQRGHLALVHSA